MKILWLSKYAMTEEQINDLKRIYGEIQIKNFNQTVSSWKDVTEAGADCNILAVDFPLAILADLMNCRNNNKPVIRAKVNMVPTEKTVVNPVTGKEETEYRFEHAGWERILKVEVVVEQL